MRDWRGLVGQVLAGEVLAAVVDVLATASIGVVPLKGVLLGRVAYADPRLRPLTDVDVLVTPGRFSQAVDCLREAGWQMGRPAKGQVSASHPRLPMPIDLHDSLFPAAMYRLSSHDVFARATPDTRLFGSPVSLPAGLDVYAHLVGHFANGRLTLNDPVQLEDFRRTVDAWALDPNDCAIHLVQHGLARAARYALPFAVERYADRFASSVLAALPRDATGELLAAGSRSLLRRLPARTCWGILPAHLLNHSLAGGVLSVALHARESWNSQRAQSRRPQKLIRFI